MSRTSSIIISVFAAVLLIGLMGGLALVLGRSYFTASAQNNVPTPMPLVTATATATVAITNTATITIVVGDVTATVEPTLAATAVPNATTVPAATISVLNTSVPYVKALVDVNMRSGPGTGYSVIGRVAAGQTAKVTGISSDNGWWRVACADGSIGNCWVTAQSQFTQQTNAPVNNPPATVAPTACTNSAALIADVSVPDGTQFAPITGFNKIWRIKNTGTCTWDSSYKIVHVGGDLMNAVSSFFPLRDSVLPGQTADLTLNMVSPSVPGTYQSDWKLQNAQGQAFGVGRGNSAFWVKIVVTGEPASTIAGLIFQDGNGNGVYDNGEEIMANREVSLAPGTACQVTSQPVATALSNSDGVYTFKGNYKGNYCVGLTGNNGLEDVVRIDVAAGQVLTTINLHAAVSNASISGYVWNDYCLLIDNGAYTDGNCVPNGSGNFRADGMLQATESNISGVTVLLQLGNCLNNNNVAVSSVTDSNGRYTFGNLNPGTYCVSINATDGYNAPTLLPGEWTFPFNNVSYQEITLQAGAQAYSVNFGWDYQFE